MSPIISGGGSSGSGAGREIGYAQITSTVNVVSTTEATGTTIISPGAFTFDGAPVICELFGYAVTPAAATATITVSLFEGATQITRLALLEFFGGSAGSQEVLSFYARYRFTPTAGPHTYTVTAFVNGVGGIPNITAGSGGTAGNPPAFVRFTKV